MIRVQARTQPDHTITWAREKKSVKVGFQQNVRRHFFPVWVDVYFHFVHCQRKFIISEAAIWKSLFFGNTIIIIITLKLFFFSLW